MPRKKPINPQQLDMHDLLSFQPANPVVSFAYQDVRATTLGKTIAKAISAALKSCSRSREDVADQMSGYLGEDVSKNMLDAYASESRTGHVISLVRFVALVSVTGDRRLLDLVAAQFGWAVIDRRYLKVIETAQMIEVRDEFNARIDANRRAMRRDGTL